MSVTVLVPQQLRSYTAGVATISGKGTSIDTVMNDVDRQYPGIRFRVIDEQGKIRAHMRVFVNGVRARKIQERVSAGAEVHIFGALSGG